MSELAALLQRYSIKRGDFVLASGAKSTYYLDVRRTALTGSGAKAIGEELYTLARRVAPDAAGCGGMTLGADPLITAMSVAAAARSAEFDGVIVRKEAKGHGTQSWLECAGSLAGDEELVAVDDVVTTAGSTIKAIEKLRAHGFVIRHALCVVDREAGGAEALQEIGVELHALFAVSELVES